MALLAARAGSYAQFITVLLLFIVVLAVTAWTTRWIAKYQKQQSANGNIQVIETTRIANNKYIQIIRVGEKYMVVAICKDTVTMLGEISAVQVKEGTPPQRMGFKQLLEKAMNQAKARQEGSKESQHEEE